jgi:hypothetical protein
MSLALVSPVQGGDFLEPIAAPLTTSQADRHPARVYLGSLSSETSRRTMAQALDRAARS